MLQFIGLQPKSMILLIIQFHGLPYLKPYSIFINQIQNFEQLNVISMIPVGIKSCFPYCIEITQMEVHITF